MRWQGLLQGSNTQKVVWFVVIAFLLSWPRDIVYGSKIDSLISASLGIVAGTSPLIATLIVQRIIYKEALAQPLAISFRLNLWFLMALLIPLVAAFATLGVSLLLPGIEYSPNLTGFYERFGASLSPNQLSEMKTTLQSSDIHPVWVVLARSIVQGVTFGAMSAFLEEIGWRGFLHRELAYLGFWKSSAIIGLIWGIWHAPLILRGEKYPEHPVLGVFMMVVAALLWSPIMSYVRIRANSVIATSIMHGTINSSLVLSVLLIRGGDDVSVGLGGFAGFLVLLAMNIGIILLRPIRQM